MVRGEMFLAGKAVIGPQAAFRAFDPTLQIPLEPPFHTASPVEVEEACRLAQAAAGVFGETSPDQRGALLESIARRIEACAEGIVARARAETGLTEARLRGELARTCGQLRLFARVARDGAWLDVRIDRALRERVPPRSDIRLCNRAVGPVVVFGASNFPLAFSVAGGDTAAALAAGCPVIVKAHHAHPGTSELVGRAVVEAVAECGLHEGTFALLFGSGATIGAALVADPRIKAVGFTGSRTGGQALMAIAQARRQPIPVYAEMSSINPVILLPGALAERAEAIGNAFAAALTLGAGQFCTNPGLLVAMDGPGLDRLLESASSALAAITPATMLTPGIHESYCGGVAALAQHTRVVARAHGATGEGLVSEAHVFETAAVDFLADPSLAHEVFGATALLVRCADRDELLNVIRSLDGQLTASIHANEADLDLTGAVLPVLEPLVGRVIFNGFGTGVEVCDAMVHGGPYPATSDGRSTSVGSLAIQRFVRPVCYQDLPTELLPAAVRDDNPWNLPRRVDGVRV